MNPYCFVPNVQFIWDDIVWTVERVVDRKKVELVDAQHHQRKIVSIAELDQALFADALRFVIPSSLTDQMDLTDTPTTCLFADLESIPNMWRAIAEWRLKVIEPLVQPGIRRTAQLVRARVQEMRQEACTQYGPIPEKQLGSLTQVVSVSSVYRWIRLYIAGGRDLRALVPRVYLRGGVGVLRIDAEVEQAIQNALQGVYLRDESATIVDAYHEAAAFVADLNNRKGLVPDDNTNLSK
jgi:hypothetical protein